MCLLPLSWVSVDPTSPLRVCLPLHAQIVMQVWQRCERTRGVACLEQVDVVVFFNTLWKSRGVGGCLKGRDRKPNSEMWNMGSILRVLSDFRWEEWRCFARPLFLQDGCIQQLGSLSGCCVMQFYLLPALSTDLRCVYKPANLFRGRVWIPPLWSWPLELRFCFLITRAHFVRAPMFIFS